ncbi:CCA tRNA nucleotidyltransferase [Thermodesulfatator atlanticus]
MKNTTHAAENFLTGTPLTIDIKSSFEQAQELFSLAGEELLVLTDGAAFKGVLRRRVLEEAMRFGLKLDLADLLEKIPAGEDFVREALKNPFSAYVLLKKDSAKSLITLKDAFAFAWEDLSENFSLEFPEELSEICTKASEAAKALGLRVFLVGGIVRDLILKRPSFDIDLVVTEKARYFAENLAQKLGARLVKTSLFGTFKLAWRDYDIDIAQARWEYYEAPARLPKTFPGPLRQDAFRRDFTINSLFLCLKTRRLIDYYGGLKDLCAKKLRVLHILSFVEDPTRIFRAARYATRFNFAFSSDTFRALSLALKLKVLSLLSSARLRNEFLRIMEEENPSLAIIFLAENRVLNELFEKVPDKFEIKRFFALATKMRLSPAEKIEAFALFLALREKDLERLDISGHKKKALWQAKLSLKEKAAFLKDPKIPLSEKVFFLEKMPREALLAASFLDEAFILKCLKCFEIKPGLSGEDLQKLGVKQGPEIGKMLKALRAAKIDGTIKPGEEEAFLRKEFADVFSS